MYYSSLLLHQVELLSGQSFVVGFSRNYEHMDINIFLKTYVCLFSECHAFGLYRSFYNISSCLFYTTFISLYIVYMDFVGMSTLCTFVMMFHAKSGYSKIQQSTARF